MVTTAKFPVLNGQTVEVACNDNFRSLEEPGSAILTCVEGRVFEVQQRLLCVQGKYCYNKDCSVLKVNIATTKIGLC